MSPAPTPDDIEAISFAARWWQEFLTGVIVIASAALLKAKGKKEPVYLAEEDIEQRMLICKQSILMAIDESVENKLQKQKKELIRELDLMLKANR